MREIAGDWLSNCCELGLLDGDELWHVVGYTVAWEEGD